MAVVWITPTVVKPSSTSWIDINVSSFIPSGATGIIIHATCSAYTYFGLRNNGSTDARTNYMQTNTHLWATIGIDAFGIFESRLGSTTNIVLYVVGYFTNESVFFTNAVAKTPTSGAWTDVSIAADTGANTAIGAFIEVCMSGTTQRLYGLRKNGSSDNITNGLYTVSSSGTHQWGIVGVDASEIFEGYISSTSLSFYMVGYIKSGAIFDTNKTLISLPTIRVWTDYQLPSGATGSMFEVTDSGGTDAGFRTNGSSEGISLLSNFHGFPLVGADANSLVEIYTSHLTATSIYRIGYFFSYISPGKVNIGGAWKNIAGVYCNIGGVWKSGTMYGNIGGVWKTT